MGPVSRNTSDQITEMLNAVGMGDDEARQQLWEMLYTELHKLADIQMASEAPGKTLQATALVHEAYLKLVGSAPGAWQSRRHFFGAAVRAMRQICVDDARSKGRLKRGGDGRRLDLSHVVCSVVDRDSLEVLAIDEALEKLEQIDRRKAEVVMCRYFADMTVTETAEALDMSARQVNVDWRFAKAWLHSEISDGRDSTDSAT